MPTSAVLDTARTGGHEHPNQTRPGSSSLAEEFRFMPVYLIERTDDVDYEETASFVVVATNEQQARELAKQSEQDNYSSTYTATSWDEATVTEVKPDGEPRIVLADFRAG
jgi:hypothetical protein